MGVTKAEYFSGEQNELAGLAKALGHPARIAILQKLLELNTCICGDLVEEIPLSQPTISQHLKELKTVGIIKGTIEGTRVNYCIDSSKWKEVQGLFNQLFDTYVADQNCDC
jgi:DNA-binding transcriptional ArsR family regulator